MPEKETKARGKAKYWKTVKTKDGHTLQVAVVRKKKGK